MLREIIELQQRAVSQLVEKIKGKKKEVTFKSPTGSGKTYMMADFMNRILETNEKVVFLVSSLSKGELAKQNYEKFVSYVEGGKFGALKPYLISTDLAGEESLYIPSEGYNVYILPRDLYKKGGKLMQGAMTQFLRSVRFKNDGLEFNKDIYLVKDECHIDTKNLDSISEENFKKIINLSATPNMKRGQTPDVEITNEEAEEAKLIKTVIWGEDDDTVEDALDKFKEIKKDYDNLLGVNPCLIIQISNKEKAEEEWSRLYDLLNRTDNQHLKWIYIVGDDKECKTNDDIRKLPVSRWKDYAKENHSLIDVIVFKMVISEGWDIPRACMLFQIRDSQSKQLDEQVMGRVRRNPRLVDFETLTEEAKQLALSAWVWGIPTEGMVKTYMVKRAGASKEIPSVLKLKTVVLKDLTQKVDFDLEDYLSECKEPLTHESVFALNEKLSRVDYEIQRMCYDYAQGDTQRWFKFAENLSDIKKNFDSYVCNYDESMEILKDDNGQDKFVSFPIESLYSHKSMPLKLNDWVWKRKDGKKNFSFDSDAEREWAEILKNLENRVSNVELTNSDVNMPSLGSEFERHRERKYLWGKNFPYNSEIRYEYYMDGKHASYPDFVMIDANGQVHIFEVKSLNESNGTSIDPEEYKKKIEALRECYRYCSKLTGYYFYIPILQEEDWQIYRYTDGKESLISQEDFENSI